MRANDTRTHGDVPDEVKTARQPFFDTLQNNDVFLNVADCVCFVLHHTHATPLCCLELPAGHVVVNGLRGAQSPRSTITCTNFSNCSVTSVAHVHHVELHDCVRVHVTTKSRRPLDYQHVEEMFPSPKQLQRSRCKIQSALERMASSPVYQYVAMDVFQSLTARKVNVLSDSPLS